MNRRLTRFENAWARAELGAFFPAHPALGPSAADLDVEGYLVDVRSRAPARAAFGIRVTIWIMALAPLFVFRRVATISSLSPAERAVLLTALLASPIYAVRQLVMAFKAIGAMLYARAPEIRAAIAPPVADPVADTGPRLITLGRKGQPAGEDDDGRHVA